MTTITTTISKNTSFILKCYFLLIKRANSAVHLRSDSLMPLMSSQSFVWCRWCRVSLLNKWIQKCKRHTMKPEHISHFQSFSVLATGKTLCTSVCGWVTRSLLWKWWVKYTCLFRQQTSLCCGALLFGGTTCVLTHYVGENVKALAAMATRQLHSLQSPLREMGGSGSMAV